MPYIVGVLEEEQDRLLGQKADYTSILKDLPRTGGSIVVKSIAGHKYHYFAYREGKKVKTKYIRKKDLETFQKKVMERDRICRIIEGIDEDLGVIEKSLRGKA